MTGGKNAGLLVGHDHSVITAGVLNGPFTRKDFSNEILEAVPQALLRAWRPCLGFWCFSRITAGG